ALQLRFARRHHDLQRRHDARDIVADREAGALHAEIDRQISHDPSRTTPVAAAPRDYSRASPNRTPTRPCSFLISSAWSARQTRVALSVWMTMTSSSPMAATR